MKSTLIFLHILKASRFHKVWTRFRVAPVFSTCVSQENEFNKMVI